MTLMILTAVAAVTAVLAIRGETRPTRTQVYIFKPTTTILIILIALLGGSAISPVYRLLILLGLLFCLGGDILLMLPRRYFIFGLVSFLIGHLLYIAAFIADAGFTFSWWLLPLLLYGGIIYRPLHPHLGRLRGPVIAYILIILLMAWQALGRWGVAPSTSATLAAIGALFFAASDSALAFDRFRARFRHARLVVRSTYWLAQWLIALSIGGYLLLWSNY
jgi:uncharacterized membrane protein YhhN